VTTHRDLTTPESGITHWLRENAAELERTP
jgi:hypothetical protein